MRKVEPKYGPTGPQGPAGDTGPTGSIGATGPTGPTGAQYEITGLTLDGGQADTEDFFKSYDLGRAT